ncbi:MAG: hypothetical protein JO057_18120 [Chloroflexi bacterium]|nr:hypothetical protein [Chloroflexota bacterium]
MSAASLSWPPLAARLETVASVDHVQQDPEPDRAPLLSAASDAESMSRMTKETVYFDHAMLLAQIGVGS